LVAPDGAGELDGGGSADGDVSETHTRLATNMGVAELTSHYREQLSRAGWTLSEEEAAAGPSTVQLYGLTDPEGRAALGGAASCPASVTFNQLRIEKR
jgi:hypothetical protein